MAAMPRQPGLWTLSMIRGVSYDKRLVPKRSEDILAPLRSESVFTLTAGPIQLTHHFVGASI